MPANPFPSAAAKILIAEDNVHNLELLEAYLSDTPFEVRTSVNGEDALKVVREWAPDVVLLDVMMPRLSGFEVCQRLRQDPAVRSTGVLMVTALDHQADIERAVDAGVDDFLTKPINKTDLLQRINALLAAKSSQPGLPRTLEYMKAIGQPE